MTLLKGKIALITGAASGIGKATAEALAGEGAHLVLLDRQEAALQALADNLAAQYALKIHAEALDITESDKVERVLQNLPAPFAEIDILINSAGVGRGLGHLIDNQNSDWDAMIDTNLKGLLYVTRPILKKMLARNSGHIVNIGSISGQHVAEGCVVYSATKSAAKAISRGIKIECQGTKVRVTEIDPGLVETGFHQALFGGDEAKAKEVYGLFQPMAPQDVAEAIVFTLTRPLHVNVAEMVINAKDQPLQLS